jgi:hypothetical protein
LREYPTFKNNWIVHAAKDFSESNQLLNLRKLVPSGVKVTVEKFTTMLDYWIFMDLKFGNGEELERNYNHPKEARTKGQHAPSFH